MICDYCHTDPGCKPETVIWKGFKDGDTSQHVCWNCKAAHYRAKFLKPGLANIYSELPVIIPPRQLTLLLRPSPSI